MTLEGRLRAAFSFAWRASTKSAIDRRGGNGKATANDHNEISKSGLVKSSFTILTGRVSMAGFILFEM
jgi:hypothetical protein